MQKHPCFVLTIVVEAALEEAVLHDIKRLGADGYTIVEAGGAGSWGARGGAWEQNQSRRIEVIGEEARVETIARHLLDAYHANYAMTLFVTRAEALRP